MSRLKLQSLELNSQHLQWKEGRNTLSSQHLLSSALSGSSCCEHPKGSFSSEYIDLFLSCHLIHLTFRALECAYHLLFDAAINNIKRISVSRFFIHTYAVGSAGFTKHLSTQHLEFSLCFHLKKQVLLQMVFSRQSGIQLFKLLQAIIVVLSIVHFINVEHCQHLKQQCFNSLPRQRFVNKHNKQEDTANLLDK